MVLGFSGIRGLERIRKHLVLGGSMILGFRALGISDFLRTAWRVHTKLHTIYKKESTLP